MFPANITIVLLVIEQNGVKNAAVICGRYVQQREIQDAIRNSGLRPATLRCRSWPAINHEQREAIITNGTGLVDLWETSPV